MKNRPKFPEGYNKKNMKKYVYAIEYDNGQSYEDYDHYIPFITDDLNEVNKILARKFEIKGKCGNTYTISAIYRYELSKFYYCKKDLFEDAPKFVFKDKIKKSAILTDKDFI